MEEVSSTDKWSSSFERLLWQIGKNCLEVLALVVIVVLSPIYLILLFRWWVAGLLVRLRRGDTAYVASGMDMMWTLDPDRPEYAINAVFFLDGEVDLEDVRSKIKYQILRPPNNDERENQMRKLTRHLADEFGVCTWREEEDFRVEDHVVLYDGPPVTTESEFQTLLSHLGPLPFPPKKSPWSLHLVRLAEPLVSSYSSMGNQFCAVFRVDHALGDGISFVSLLLRYVVDPSNIPLKPPPLPKTTQGLPGRTRRILNAIFHGCSIVLDYLTRTESNTLHDAPLTQNKLVRYSRPIPLQVFRDIRAATGTTVNDIYLSCVAGTLRRHFLACDSPFPAIPKSVIPISLHTDPANAPLENNFSVALIDIPIHLDDPLKRLEAIGDIMRTMKSSSEILVNAWSFKWIAGVFPLWMTRRAFRATPATLVTATVPGPTQKISMWGHQMNRILYFAPHRGTTGVTSCMISYAGQVILTFYVDASLVSTVNQVDNLVNGFHIELERLAAAAQQTVIKDKPPPSKDSFDQVENETKDEPN